MSGSQAFGLSTSGGPGEISANRKKTGGGVLVLSSERGGNPEQVAGESLVYVTREKVEQVKMGRKTAGGWSPCGKFG